jgi:hypothetical protein
MAESIEHRLLKMDGDLNLKEDIFIMLAHCTVLYCFI